MKKIMKTRWGIRQLHFLNIKITLLFFIGVLFQLKAGTVKNESRVSLDVDGVELAQILNELESLTEFKFVFNAKKINLNKKVSFTCEKEKISTILPRLFYGMDIAYEVFNKQILLKPLPKGKKTSLDSNTQVTKTVQFRVTGTVTDANNLPLAGANIIEKGSSKGTQTDFDGNFSIEVAHENATLSISFIGFKSREINLQGKSNLTIILAEDSEQLQEVVLVGYGTQKKVSVTNAISTVAANEIASRPVVSTGQGLQGVASGVTVLDNGGRPGANNLKIRIRGLTSFNDGNNAPLIIIDGIEQRLNDLNPNDIENISILKDASSTAIYGSRAANGVVLITTKNGKSGKTSVEYNGYFGIQDAINRPEHMELGKYLELENVARANAGRDPFLSEQEIQEYVSATDREQFPLPFPWFDRRNGVFKMAPQQNHTLSVSGGTEKMVARMSIRHQNIEGIVDNFSDKTNEVRLNTAIHATERLTIDTNLNFRMGESLQPVAGEYGVFNFMLHATKFAYPQYASGEYGLGPQNNNVLLNARLSGDVNYWNDYFIGSTKATYELAPGLKFSSQYALRYSNTRQKSYREKYYNEDPYNGRVKQSQINSVSEYRSNSREFTWNNLLTYTVNFGLHEIGALAGYSTIDNSYNQLVGYRENFYNNDVQSIGQGSDANKNADGYDRQYGLRSYFGRINYNYNNTYFAEINGRYDGSSRFGKGNRYAFFPSGSLGWRVSQEKFWEPLYNSIQEFKIRASYGHTGNQAIPQYQFFETLSTGTYSFNEEAATTYRQTSLANQNLVWETSKQLDIGFDLGLMNNQINFSFDYYNKRTEDILLRLPIPGTVGLNAPYQNAGVVENKGVEFSASVKGGNKFQYSIGANFSYNKNEVIDLSETGPYISGNSPNETFIIEEGLPINSFWGYLTDGFFQTQEEIDNYPTLFNNTKPGDVKYLDLNGDGIVNPDDRAEIGQSFPIFNYGATINLDYGLLNLFMQWQGAGGHKTHISGGLSHLATYEAFTHAIYTDDYWTPEHRDARFPRPIKGDQRNRQTSEDMMIDADYLRLKNLVLSFNFPNHIVKQIGASKAKLFTGATNVLTFSKLNEWDLDPETPAGRANFYPQTRVYTIGLNVIF